MNTENGYTNNVMTACVCEYTHRENTHTYAVSYFICIGLPAQLGVCLFSRLYKCVFHLCMCACDACAIYKLDAQRKVECVRVCQMSSGLSSRHICGLKIHFNCYESTLTAPYIRRSRQTPSRNLEMSKSIVYEAYEIIPNI